MSNSFKIQRQNTLTWDHPRYQSAIKLTLCGLWGRCELLGVEASITVDGVVFALSDPDAEQAYAESNNKVNVLHQLYAIVATLSSSFVSFDGEPVSVPAEPETPSIAFLNECILLLCYRRFFLRAVEGDQVRVPWGNLGQTQVFGAYAVPLSTNAVNWLLTSASATLGTVSLGDIDGYFPLVRLLYGDVPDSDDHVDVVPAATVEAGPYAITQSVTFEVPISVERIGCYLSSSLRSGTGYQSANTVVRVNGSAIPSSCVIPYDITPHTSSGTNTLTVEADVDADFVTSRLEVGLALQTQQRGFVQNKTVKHNDACFTWVRRQSVVSFSVDEIVWYEFECLSPDKPETNVKTGYWRTGLTNLLLELNFPSGEVQYQLRDDDYDVRTEGEAAATPPVTTLPFKYEQDFDAMRLSASGSEESSHESVAFLQRHSDLLNQCSRIGELVSGWRESQIGRTKDVTVVLSSADQMLFSFATAFAYGDGVGAGYGTRVVVRVVSGQLTHTVETLEEVVSTRYVVGGLEQRSRLRYLPTSPYCQVSYNIEGEPVTGSTQSGMVETLIGPPSVAGFIAIDECCGGGAMEVSVRVINALTRLAGGPAAFTLGLNLRLNGSVLATDFRVGEGSSYRAATVNTGDTFEIVKTSTTSPVLTSPSTDGFEEGGSYTIIVLGEVTAGGWGTLSSVVKTDFPTTPPVGVGVVSIFNVITTFAVSISVEGGTPLFLPSGGWTDLELAPGSYSCHLHYIRLGVPQTLSLIITVVAGRRYLGLTILSPETSDRPIWRIFLDANS